MSAAAEDHALWLKAPGLLLEHLGIEEPGEIDLEAIAQACGATIVYEPLEGSEARLLGVGHRAVITVKAGVARPRQRFSAAHELGHWLHDRGHVALSSCAEGKMLEEWGQKGRERRANRFASNLLLPRTMFKPLARNKPMSFGTARALGETFETSLTATAIRLVELGSFPALLACYNGAELRWSVRNGFVPECLRARPHIAPELAYAPQEDVPRAYPAEAWIAHRDALFYTVHAETWMSGPRTRLVLITWRNEAQLVDAAAETAWMS